MPDQPSSVHPPSRWLSRRTHLQISHTHVLPLLFKSRALPISPEAPLRNPPPAFPDAEVDLSHGMHLIKDWILNHLDRIYRHTPANLKPGTLETPNILKSSTHQFTVWLEPTAAALSLLAPHSNKSLPSSSNKPRSSGNHPPPLSDASSSFDSFRPTPQTLHVTAELIDETE